MSKGRLLTLASPMEHHLVWSAESEDSHHCRRTNMTSMEKVGRPWHIKYDKDFIKRRSLAEVGELICQESTAHGVGHAWNNRRNVLGIVWLLITATFLVFLAFVTKSHVEDFNHRDIQSQAKMYVSLQTTRKVADAEGLRLPSVTICNRDFFSRRKLKALNVSRSLTTYLMAITGSALVLGEDLPSTPEGQDFLKEAQDQLLHLMHTANLSHHQLIDAISYRCEDLILQCSVGHHRMNKTECCRKFTPMPSLTGKCYTHLSTDDNTQTTEGEYMGISLLANVTEEDYPELDNRFVDVTTFVKTGLQVSFLDRQTHPAFAVVGQGVTLVPKVYTAVSISLAVVKDVGMKTFYDWSEDRCISPEKVNYQRDKEGFFNIQENCVLGATRACFRHFCNCSNYSLDYARNDSWSPCSVQESIRCYGLTFGAVNVSSISSVYDAILSRKHRETNGSLADQCWREANSRCRHTCTWNDYTYTSTHLPIHGRLYQELRRQFSLPNGSDVAVVMAFFPNLRYTETQLRRKGLQEFMSTLGGYTGVFLGCSFVTFIEIFVFLALVLAVLARDIKQKVCGNVRPYRTKSSVHELN
ncbi:uncharacterized protein [Panulirus ornatus]|uniref:uncharacterized protein n=1 Tax=Panulirus ornatus TaxID=150431 RepID=UPI003A83CD69